MYVSFGDSCPLKRRIKPVSTEFTLYLIYFCQSWAKLQKCNIRCTFDFWLSRRGTLGLCPKPQQGSGAAPLHPRQFNPLRGKGQRKCFLCQKNSVWGVQERKGKGFARSAFFFCHLPRAPALGQKKNGTPLHSPIGWLLYRRGGPARHCAARKLEDIGVPRFSHPIIYHYRM